MTDETPSRLTLEKLEIERQFYGPEKGKFAGHIRFGKDKTSIRLALNNAQCETILDICADALVDTARELAGTLREHIMAEKPEEQKHDAK